MGRNYLTGRDGDRINAVLAAAGYNFSLLLRWFEELLRVLLYACRAAGGDDAIAPQRKLWGSNSECVHVRRDGWPLQFGEPNALEQPGSVRQWMQSFDLTLFRGEAQRFRADAAPTNPHISVVLHLDQVANALGLAIRSRLLQITPTDSARTPLRWVSHPFIPPQAPVKTLGHREQCTALLSAPFPNGIEAYDASFSS